MTLIGIICKRDRLVIRGASGRGTDVSYLATVTTT